MKMIIVNFAHDFAQTVFSSRGASYIVLRFVEMKIMSSSFAFSSTNNNVLLIIYAMHV